MSGKKRSNGQEVFLNEIRKNIKTFVSGAAKDVLGFDLPDPIAEQLAVKFQGFFGGLLDQFVNDPSAAPQKKRVGARGGAAGVRGPGAGPRVVSPAKLESRRGLFAELPLMFPCRVEEGELILDLYDFDFWEELNTLLAEWKDDQSVQIKIWTKEGQGDCFSIPADSVDVNVNIGDQEDGYHDPSVGSGGFGSSKWE